VRRHRSFATGPDEQAPGGGIEHHGIAAGDALHDGVSEMRCLGEQRREADSVTLLVDQARTAAVQRRHFGVDLRQPGESARQLVGLPDVILIAEGKVIRLDALFARQAEEIGGEPASGSVSQLEPVAPHAPLKVDEYGPRLVVRGVVRGVDAPVRVALGGDRPELFVKKESAPARAEQNGHPLAGAFRRADISSAGALTQHRRWRFYFHDHFCVCESWVEYSMCTLPICLSVIRRKQIIL
jgi:hypothetical protein